MITKSTVLVLGAGASEHLGYPLGRSLKDKIVHQLKDDPNSIRQLFALRLNEREIDQFTEALQLSGRKSVDEFLEHRKEFIDIGKAAIAQALIEYEDPGKLHPDGWIDKNLPLNWFEYLWGKMSDCTFEQLGENKLSGITFNYDRALEMFLFTAIQHAYGKLESEAASALKLIPIIHVHGKLAHLPWEGQSHYRAYESLVDPTNIGIAMGKIKIIHESTEDDPEFQAASALLHEAERIYFLGFGYHAPNVRRLQGPWNKKAYNATTLGTCFDFTDQERVTATAQFSHQLKVFDADWDVLQFLRERGELT